MLKLDLESLQNKQWAFKKHSQHSPIHTHSHTFTHCRQRHSNVTIHTYTHIPMAQLQDQFLVQYLPQGHFETWTAGVGMETPTLWSLYLLSHSCPNKLKLMCVKPLQLTRRSISPRIVCDNTVKLKCFCQTRTVCVRRRHHFLGCLISGCSRKLCCVCASEMFVRKWLVLTLWSIKELSYWKALRHYSPTLVSTQVDLESTN